MSPYLEKEQAFIIERGTALTAYMFASDIPDADIEALQRVVIERGSAEDIRLFARDIPKADAEFMLDSILERGDALSLSLYAVNTEGRLSEDGFRRLQQKVLDTGDSSTLYFFATCVPGADTVNLLKACIDRDERVKGLAAHHYKDVLDSMITAAKPYTAHKSMSASRM